MAQATRPESVPGRLLGRFLGCIVRWGAAALLCVLATLSLLVGTPALAGEARPTTDQPELEAHMLRITAELRCLVCQNQTIADSHSGLAEDLRQQVRELLAQGKSEAEIYDYMTARYGDFVLYKPPFKSTTALLWLAPLLLATTGLVALVLVLRRRSRLADACFDPSTQDDES